MDRLIKPDKTNTRLPPTPPTPELETVDVELPQSATTLTNEEMEVDGV